MNSIPVNTAHLLQPTGKPLQARVPAAIVGAHNTALPQAAQAAWGPQQEGPAAQAVVPPYGAAPSLLDAFPSALIAASPALGSLQQPQQQPWSAAQSPLHHSQEGHPSSMPPPPAPVRRATAGPSLAGSKRSVPPKLPRQQALAQQLQQQQQAYPGSAPQVHLGAAGAPPTAPGSASPSPVLPPAALPLAGGRLGKGPAGKHRAAQQAEPSSDAVFPTRPRVPPPRAAQSAGAALDGGGGSRGGHASSAAAVGGGHAAGYCRKDKSLGLLTEHFLDFCAAVPGGVVSLDAAATSLGVERRRIYDVTNILEALDVVSRRTKNAYTWHGTAAIAATIKKLLDSALVDAGRCDAIVPVEAIRGEPGRYRCFGDLGRQASAAAASGGAVLPVTALQGAVGAGTGGGRSGNASSSSASPRSQPSANPAAWQWASPRDPPAYLPPAPGTPGSDPLAAYLSVPMSWLEPASSLAAARAAQGKAGGAHAPALSAPAPQMVGDGEVYLEETPGAAELRGRRSFLPPSSSSAPAPGYPAHLFAPFDAPRLRSLPLVSELVFAETMAAMATGLPGPPQMDGASPSGSGGAVTSTAARRALLSTLTPSCSSASQIRRDRSLGVLTQRFIKLFLLDRKVMSMEYAASVVIPDDAEGEEGGEGGSGEPSIVTKGTRPDSDGGSSPGALWAALTEARTDAPGWWCGGGGGSGGGGGLAAGSGGLDGEAGLWGPLPHVLFKELYAMAMRQGAPGLRGEGDHRGTAPASSSSSLSSTSSSSSLGARNAGSSSLRRASPLSAPMTQAEMVAEFGPAAAAAAAAGHSPGLCPDASKLKVRRLYDIANVLVALRLIERVTVRVAAAPVAPSQHHHSTASFSRKPALRWRGPAYVSVLGGSPVPPWAIAKRLPTLHAAMVLQQQLCGPEGAPYQDGRFGADGDPDAGAAPRKPRGSGRRSGGRTGLAVGPGGSRRLSAASRRASAAAADGSCGGSELGAAEEAQHEGALEAGGGPAAPELRGVPDMGELPPAPADASPPARRPVAKRKRGGRGDGAEEGLGAGTQWEGAAGAQGQRRRPAPGYGAPTFFGYPTAPAPRVVSSAPPPPGFLLPGEAALGGSGDKPLGGGAAAPAPRGAGALSRRSHRSVAAAAPTSGPAAPAPLPLPSSLTSCPTDGSPSQQWPLGEGLGLGESSGCSPLSAQQLRELAAMGVVPLLLPIGTPSPPQQQQQHPRRRARSGARGGPAAAGSDAEAAGLPPGPMTVLAPRGQLSASYSSGLSLGGLLLLPPAGAGAEGQHQSYPEIRSSQRPQGPLHSLMHAPLSRVTPGPAPHSATGAPASASSSSSSAAGAGGTGDESGLTGGLGLRVRARLPLLASSAKGPYPQSLLAFPYPSASVGGGLLDLGASLAEEDEGGEEEGPEPGDSPEDGRSGPVHPAEGAAPMSNEAAPGGPVAGVPRPRQRRVRHRPALSRYPSPALAPTPAAAPAAEVGAVAAAPAVPSLAENMRLVFGMGGGLPPPAHMGALSPISAALVGPLGGLADLLLGGGEGAAAKAGVVPASGGHFPAAERQPQAHQPCGSGVLLLAEALRLRAPHAPLSMPRRSPSSMQAALADLGCDFPGEPAAPQHRPRGQDTPAPGAATDDAFDSVAVAAAHRFPAPPAPPGYMPLQHPLVPAGGRSSSSGGVLGGISAAAAPLPAAHALHRSLAPSQPRSPRSQSPSQRHSSQPHFSLGGAAGRAAPSSSLSHGDLLPALAAAASASAVASGHLRMSQDSCGGSQGSSGGEGAAQAAAPTASPPAPAASSSAAADARAGAWAGDVAPLGVSASASAQRALTLGPGAKGASGHRAGGTACQEGSSPVRGASSFDDGPLLRGRHHGHRTPSASLLPAAHSTSERNSVLASVGGLLELRAGGGDSPHAPHPAAGGGESPPRTLGMHICGGVRPGEGPFLSSSGPCSPSAIRPAPAPHGAAGGSSEEPHGGREAAASLMMSLWVRRVKSVGGGEAEAGEGEGESAVADGVSAALAGVVSTAAAASPPAPLPLHPHSKGPVHFPFTPRAFLSGGGGRSGSPAGFSAAAVPTPAPGPKGPALPVAARALRHQGVAWADQHSLPTPLAPAQCAGLNSATAGAADVPPLELGGHPRSSAPNRDLTLGSCAPPSTTPHQYAVPPPQGAGVLAGAAGTGGSGIAPGVEDGAVAVAILSLVQRQQVQGAVAAGAGEVPPPPPRTWEELQHPGAASVQPKGPSSSSDRCGPFSQSAAGPRLSLPANTPHAPATRERPSSGPASAGGPSLSALDATRLCGEAVEFGDGAAAGGGESPALSSAPPTHHRGAASSAASSRWLRIPGSPMLHIASPAPLVALSLPAASGAASLSGWVKPASVAAGAMAMIQAAAAGSGGEDLSGSPAARKRRRSVALDAPLS